VTLRPCKEREQRIDSLLHSCPVLCTELGLQGMARLATSSKSMRVTCHSIVSSGRATWLVSATGIQEEAQRLQAAAWVLQATPVAAYTAEVLVRAPSLPLHIAKQIVAAGARVTFTPLLAAASSMAAGLEVWVQAQKELGIRTDIPSAAEAICCSSIRDIYINWVSLILWRDASCSRARGDHSWTWKMHWYMGFQCRTSNAVQNLQCHSARPLVMR
jgi:hypothetical protein